MNFRIDPSSISLKRMATRKAEGWRVYHENAACGTIKFQEIVAGEFKGYASLAIHISKPKRGLHIGRIALEKSISSSQYQKFFATLRKNNVASFRALSACGFYVYSTHRQYTMLYEK